MTEIIEIKIPFQPGTPAAIDLFEWAKENSIKIVGPVIWFKSGKIGSARTSYVISFESEEDAAAFKLRWS